jgi:hypothetical protein
MACPICQRRKGKRACPAKGEAICSQCCGREREVTIGCPFDCVYLQEARGREAGALRPDAAAYPDIRIERGFLEEHEDLVKAAAHATLLGTLGAPGTVDKDVREALDAQIQTQRTLEGGIYYETQPDSTFAKAVASALKEGVGEFRQRETEALGMTRTRDSDVVKALVFLLRMAQDRDNGRPKGRGFLHLLARQFDMEKQAPAASTTGGLIVPGR